MVTKKNPGKHMRRRPFDPKKRAAQAKRAIERGDAPIESNMARIARAYPQRGDALWFLGGLAESVPAAVKHFWPALPAEVTAAFDGAAS